MSSPDSTKHDRPGSTTQQQLPHDPLSVDNRLTDYVLPSGEVVAIREDVARGAAVITFTLRSGEVVNARRCQLSTSPARTDFTREQLDALYDVIEALDTARTFITRGMLYTDTPAADRLTNLERSVEETMKTVRFAFAQARKAGQAQ